METRRKFLGKSAAAAAALTLPVSLSRCSGEVYKPFKNEDSAKGTCSLVQPDRAYRKIWTAYRQDMGETGT